jgi:organic hydroperoxide reductase OsmC/OhrA
MAASSLPCPTKRRRTAADWPEWMHTYSATINWDRSEKDFTNNAYSRGHTWTFDGGLVVPASASPNIVPLPHSVAENVDPEEAFVAALSSCHMLFFLAIAAARGVIVDEYTDAAVGYMGEDDRGRTSMTKIVLRPKACYSGDNPPSEKQIERIHHRAHEMCFVANSVRSEIIVEVVS